MCTVQGTDFLVDDEKNPYVMFRPCYLNSRLTMGQNWKGLCTERNLEVTKGGLLRTSASKSTAVRYRHENTVIKRAWSGGSRR